MEKAKRKRLHDPFFRWLFAVVKHLRLLQELSGKVNAEVRKFLSMVNLDTLVRIPDSYSNVDDTGEADLAFIRSRSLMTSIPNTFADGRCPTVVHS